MINVYAVLIVAFVGAFTVPKFYETFQVLFFCYFNCKVFLKSSSVKLSRNVLKELLYTNFCSALCL